jgi:flagellar basal body-associated protein FliL
MKNNKLICIILSLLVCLSLVVSASATTESDLVFTLESDSSVENLNGAAVVGSGDTFTVTVSLEKNPGIRFAPTALSFDSAKLQLVSYESLDKTAVSIVEVKDGEVITGLRINIGSYMAMFDPNAGAVVNNTGAIAKLTFKVLVDADAVDTIALAVDQRDVVNHTGKYDCTVAGASLNANIVGNNHNHAKYGKVSANNAIAPGCTEPGKKADSLCAHCGALVAEGDMVSFTGHTWDDGVITTEPTCGAMGVRTFTCVNCGQTKLDEHVPATGEHVFGEWQVTTPATVEAEGVETRTCACGETETRSIAKLPAPQPEPQPEPKDNTLLIVIIVAVVVVAAGVAAFFVLKNKKKQ